MHMLSDMLSKPTRQGARRASLCSASLSTLQKGLHGVRVEVCVHLKVAVPEIHV